MPRTPLLFGFAARDQTGPLRAWRQMLLRGGRDWLGSKSVWGSLLGRRTKADAWARLAPAQTSRFVFFGALLLAAYVNRFGDKPFFCENEPKVPLISAPLCNGGFDVPVCLSCPICSRTRDHCHTHTHITIALSHTHAGQARHAVSQPLVCWSCLQLCLRAQLHLWYA